MTTLNSPFSRSTTGAELAAVRNRLQRHVLYDAIREPAHLRAFVERHVMCVFDFMSLLKSLQRDLTCTTVPWTPTQDPAATRFIQQIAVDEESDVRADGRVQSHFVWYLEAMSEIGADTEPIRCLVHRLNKGDSLRSAIRASALPREAVAFGDCTASFLNEPVHVRAAVFFHGREEIIPEMFLPIVERLASSGLACAGLVEYLERHIEVDGGDHGPMASALLERLYAGDATRRAEAEHAALISLCAREQLWDDIAAIVAS